MPEMTVDIDVSGLDFLLRHAERSLESDLDDGSREAAREGLEAAKHQHPYADHTPEDGLTDSARVEPDPRGGWFMTWPVDYASYVDQGTSRSNPYPFTPLAEMVAERGLEHYTHRAIGRFKSLLER